MAYTVEILPAAQRHLDKLAKKNPRDARAIIEAIFDLELEPLPKGMVTIKGSASLFRIRVGNYRVIYGVDGAAVNVAIIRAGDRKDVYDADPKLLQRAFEAWVRSEREEDPSP